MPGDSKKLQQAVDFIIDHTKEGDSHNDVRKKLAAKGIQYSLSYIGNIRVDITKGTKKHSQAVVPFSPVAAHPPTPIPQPKPPEEPTPAVKPPSDLAKLLGQIKDVKFTADRVGGYDRLIEIAQALQTSEAA